MATAESDRTIRRLADKGKRITPERELLLRIIAQNAHLDAAEIYEIARRERPRIGLATVYRTLNLLKELGVVRASELGETHRHFEVRQDEHVHLICSCCGRVVDMPPPEALHRMAASRGFRIERSHLEIVGLCAACQSESANVTEDGRK
jgi:Fe2+ or Zn2+ uptake regulation protein